MKKNLLFLPCNIAAVQNLKSGEFRAVKIVDELLGKKTAIFRFSVFSSCY